MRRAGALPVAMTAAAAALAGCIPTVDDRPVYDTAPTPRIERMERTEQMDRVDRPGPIGEVTQLPAPRPAWEARPVTPNATDIATQQYVVAPGDTLRAIADRTGAGSEAIARANQLPPPFTIRAGQTLVIPGGRYHQVRQGETGIAIARAYGVPWSQVVTANALTDPYILRTGQRVLIPGEIAVPRDAGSAASSGTPTYAPPSAAQRAAAFTLDIDSIITGGEPAVAENQRPAAPVATPKRVLAATTPVIAPPIAAPGRFTWPVLGNVVRHYGPGASGERNDGIKIAVPVSTPIKATADGTVAYVGDGIAALGGLVIVRHGGGWTSVYGHASKLLVRRGQAVKRGDTLALSGDSGFADRPEVHFELRQGRNPVDPERQLPRR